MADNIFAPKVKPGDPTNCLVMPCPPDCSGFAACREAKGFPTVPSNKPSEAIFAVQAMIAERDCEFALLTGDNSNDD